MRVLRLSNDKMYIVVTYDITNDKARSKIVKILESYGYRVQKSVFEIELTKSQYIRIKKALVYWLGYARDKYESNDEDSQNTPNNDSIKFYILSKAGEGSLDGRIDGMGEGYRQAYFEEVLIL